jgi:peptidoglycan DL-endopeptidase CwlO
MMLAPRCTLRTAIRGTSIAAAVALMAGTCLVPAQAAGPAAFAQSFTALPASPQVPTPDEIAAAKANESATSTEVAKIETLLDDATKNLQTTTTASMRANDAYTNALLTLQKRKDVAAAAHAQAAAADKVYGEAKTQVGQLAGDLYKNGGMTPSVQSMLTGAASPDALYQASTLMVLGENRSRVFQNAQTAAASAKSLQDQASQASQAAAEAARAADDARTSATAANDAQNKVIADNAAQRTTLITQLATLHNTTVAMEDARVTALQQQKDQARLAAIVAASANKPAPSAPPAVVAQASGNQSSGNQSSGNQSSSGTNQGGVTAPSAVNNAAPPAANPAPPVSQPDPPAAPPAPQPQPEPEPAPAPAPPPSNGSGIQGMVNYALSKVGGPYVYGAAGPTAFDCSGLVLQAFASVGISVARTGTAQFWQAPVRVPISQMRYGDLLVFNDDGTGNFSHIAIYIGGGQVVQALNPGQGIQVTPLSWMSGMNLYGYAARY